MGERRRDWARARNAFFAAVDGLGLPEPEVGRVRKLGAGLSRSAFAAEVDPGVEGWPKVLVALVPPRPSREREPRVRREARLLGCLGGRDLGFRVSGLAVALIGEDAILVCEHLEGLSADLRTGRMHALTPWGLVGSVAAAVHRVPTDELDWLEGFGTRREHGEHLVGELSVLQDAPRAEARAALDWLRRNLPPPEPSTLVHADLLGQNLLLEPGRAPAVIDWENALRGDPAFDLAIVTRGVRRPFQMQDGMRKLLDAYAAGSANEMREEQVRFHEICLHLEWYRRAVSGEPGTQPAEQVLARLRNCLQAVGAHP